MMRGPMRGPGPAHYSSRPPPFDMIFAEDSFDRVNQVDEAPLTQEMTACASRVAASAAEKAAVLALSKRVLAALQRIVADADINTMKIDEFSEVGSVKTDTALSGQCIADVVVFSPILSTFETVTTFTIKLSELLSSPNEFVSCVPKDFGCHIFSNSAQVKVLVATTPAIVSLIEPDLHLPEENLRNAYMSVRHAQWVEGVSQMGPIKELIRVMKDVRRRFSDLQCMDIWTTQFLCYFALMQTPDRSPLPLGPAFRRIFQLLSAGIFLPGGPPLVDPTEPNHYIGSSMTFQQMDTLCCTAQTILRLLVNGGYGVVLGTAMAEYDISTNNTVFNGLVIQPSRPVYTEGCMDPKEEESRHPST